MDLRKPQLSSWARNADRAPWITFAMNGNFGAHNVSELRSNMNPVCLVQMQNVRCFELGDQSSPNPKLPDFLILFFTWTNTMSPRHEWHVLVHFSSPAYRACSFYHGVQLPIEYRIFLLKTSRVYCSKRSDHNGSFQSQHILHGCTRKFTSNSYILVSTPCKASNITYRIFDRNQNPNIRWPNYSKMHSPTSA